jgi:hypothetical protein
LRTALIAEDWFKKFKGMANRDKKLNKLINSYWPKAVPEGKWTPPMRDLLMRMAKKNGFTVANESRVVCGQRADQRWLEGKISQVVIEHESRADKNLDGEIEKLCNDVSKLKVLITYLADDKFDESALKVARRINDAIASQAASFTGEFLLIIAGWVKNDWVAFRSILQPHIKKIN